MKTKSGYSLKVKYLTLRDDSNYDKVKEDLLSLANGGISIPPKDKVDWVKYQFVATVFYTQKGVPFDALVYDPLKLYTKNIEIDDNEDSKLYGWGLVTKVAQNDCKLRYMGLSYSEIHHLGEELLSPDYLHKS